ncbi:hypothetical protein ACWGSK_03235 [Nocardiopsis sp. NPDC055551]
MTAHPSVIVCAVDPGRHDPGAPLVRRDRTASVSGARGLFAGR